MSHGQRAISIGYGPVPGCACGQSYNMVFCYETARVPTRVRCSRGTSVLGPAEQASKHRSCAALCVRWCTAWHSLSVILAHTQRSCRATMDAFGDTHCQL